MQNQHDYVVLRRQRGPDGRWWSAKVGGRSRDTMSTRRVRDLFGRGFSLVMNNLSCYPCQADRDSFLDQINDAVSLPTPLAHAQKDAIWKHLVQEGCVKSGSMRLGNFKKCFYD